MWKDSNRNIVVIFQPNILRIVGFYVRHSAFELSVKKPKNHLDRLLVKLLYLKLNFGLVPETKS